MTGEEKAALLLLQLGPQKMEAVLSRVGAERAARLRAQIQRLQKAPHPADSVASVLRELEESLQAPGAPAAPPEPATPTLRLVGAPREEVQAPAPAPKSEPESEQEADTDPLRALARLDPERVAASMRGEKPRPIALVLSCLEVERAAEIFKRLPAEVRREASLLLGSGALPGVEVARRIAQALLEKSHTVTVTAAAGGDDRVKRLAEMLRQLGKTERMDVLATMQERDSATATAVREYLYLFEDILTLDNRSMQKVLGEIDPKTLATALKGATDEIQAKVFANLSQRARDVLKEEMEFLASVPAGQIQQAQKQITDVVQRLDLAGELTGLE